MYGDPIVTATGRDIGVVPLVLNDTAQTFLKHERVEPFYNARDSSRFESSKSVRLEGRYFVGTYDHRPSESSVPGGVQGDEHVGAMWSAPFVIEEKGTISFLIGGGCNARDERLELVVDGIGSARVATGQCDETMRRVVWNVDEYVGRAGIIRAVDNSKSLWGHINFDDIQFSWSSSVTSSSGAAFVFRRHENDEYETTCRCACVNETTISASSCVCDRSNCLWTQETKLVASDLRSNMRFGSSVDVSGDVIVVGATRTVSSPRMKSDDEGGAVYIYVRPEVSSASYASWCVHGAYHTSSYTNMLEYKYEQASDLWSDEILRHNFGSHTTSFEYAKIVPWISTQRSNLGASVSLRGYSLAVGAPMASTTPWEDGSGAVAVRDIESVSTLTFSSRVYAVSETQDSIDLWIYRTSHESTLRGDDLDVMYSTSDVTARGVNSSVFSTCLSTPIQNRGLICGDYEKVQGVVTFSQNQTSARIRVNITDDKCREDRTKEFVVSLGIVGNERIDSQYHEAVVRVEDDDFDMAYCQR